MKKSKKSLKGMTLVEMIISIAIFAIMGGLLVLVGTHIDATNRATNVLKSKVANESPYAANKQKEYNVDESTKKDFTKSDITVDISIDEIGDEASVTLEAEKYNTRDIVEEGLSDADKAAMRKKANGGLNLQFVDWKSDSDDESEGEETPEETPAETPAETPEETPAETPPESGDSE